MQVKKEQYEPCNIDEATAFMLKGRLYTCFDEAAVHDNGTINLRMEFDRWAEFHTNDLIDLGIQPMKRKVVKPIEFIANAVWENGEIYEVNGSQYQDGMWILCPVIGAATNGMGTKKFKCVEILESE